MLTTGNISHTPVEDKNLWRTPTSLFARLMLAHGPFDLDVAAEAASALCPFWFGPGSALGEDALAASWALPGRPTRAFGNPPYGRGQVYAFVSKAAAESALGHCQATLLLPAATDQNWWHEFVWSNRRCRPQPGVAVEFPRGRVRFLRPDGRPAGSPTFASVIVTFACRDASEN